ncbi:acyl carrier protein [Wukongibacter sp. M2B1]|uniref:acyl carrier protein n=1 Tax=Wukongibacter sp. M2B1 TaxID=3088895 RepID=UPI003D7AF632
MSIERNEMIKRVYKIMGEILMWEFQEEDWDLDTELTEIGFNSMNFVKLGVMLEDEFGIKLSVAELDFANSVFSTVQSLVSFIEEKQVRTK